MAHPLQFAPFLYTQWHHPVHPDWPFPRPESMFAPPPYPPRGSTLLSTFVSQYPSKQDPLVLLILILATHDISYKWKKMVEVSRLLPANRLWMKDRDELALNVALYTDIADELRDILVMKGRVNPGNSLHPPGQLDVRGDQCSDSPNDGSAILAEQVCIKRRNSNPGGDKRSLWLTDFVEVQ